MKRATKLQRRNATSASQWQSVMNDLEHQLRAQRPGEYSLPMHAYAMSVARLESEVGKSILSTLCLFPSVIKAPKEVIDSIWRSQRSRASQSDTDANAFEDGLDSLVEANIVDVRPSAHGNTEGAWHAAELVQPFLFTVCI